MGELALRVLFESGDEHTVRFGAGEAAYGIRMRRQRKWRAVVMWTVGVAHSLLCTARLAASSSLDRVVRTSWLEASLCTSTHGLTMRARLHVPLRTIIDAVPCRNPQRARRIVGVIAARCGHAWLPVQLWERIAEELTRPARVHG
jgi:hypothetical protein